MKENKLRQLYKKHPTFRICLDAVDSFSNIANVVGTLLMAISILLIVILVYIVLPENLKTPITVIVGGTLSAFAFPAIIEHLRVRHDQKLYMHQQNAQIEEPLIKLLLELEQEGSQPEQQKIAKQISDYIADNYYYFCLNYNRVQIDRLYLLKDECDMVYKRETKTKASMDALLRFAQKHLDQMRKYGYISGKAYIDDRITIKSETK